MLIPVFNNSVSRPEIKSNEKELNISIRCEEFFGAEITEQLLREFEEQNPNMRLRLLNNIDGFSEKEPDIFIFDDGDFNGLVAGGTLMALESYLQYGFPDFQVAGQFAIPLVSFMDLLFYNIELLQNAGFDRPPKTRDEFFTYARTVSGDAVGAAIGLSPKDRQALSRDIFSWIWAAGNDFWPEENSSQNTQTPVFDTRPIIADITFLGRLYREGVLAPMSFEATGDQRLEEFAQGKIAMMVASSRVIPALREKMGDDAFGITTIPGSDLAGKYSIGISSFYAGIGADSPYPDEAWAFLEFLAGQRALLCEELRAVPGVVSDLFPGDYVTGDPFYSKARDIFYSSEIVYGFYGKTGAQEFENAVREELQIFFETSRTAQETASAIQRRWDNVRLTNGANGYDVSHLLR